MYQATTSIRLRRIHFCFWLLGALLLSANPLQAAQVLYPGAILIVSAADGTNSSGALFVVNPTNGDRSLLSDFGNPAQGPLANRDIVGVALNWNGAIYVSTLFFGSDGFGAIFEVNPQNGNRTIVVDFGQGELQGYPYYGLAEDVLGNLFANLYSGTPPYPATVARVNPRTDNRAFVSNFDDSTVSAQFITDVALGQFGQIVVGAILNAPDLSVSHAVIFQVNQITGARRLLTDFTDLAQGTDVGDLYFSTGLRESCGRILANSGDSVQAPRNLLFNINPVTGNRTVLSDFDNPAQGPTGRFLEGLDVERSGSLIVSAQQVTDEHLQLLLFRVNPRTGSRTVFSDSNNAAQGPPFFGVTYLAVVSPGQACP